MNVQEVLDSIDEMIRLRNSRVPSLNQMRAWRAAVEALYAENARLRAAVEWLPISEAPRDGARILARHDGFYAPFVVRWEDGDWTGDDNSIRNPTHFQPPPRRRRRRSDGTAAVSVLWMH